MTRRSDAPSSAPIRSFAALIRGRARPVQRLARTIRMLVAEELPGVEESFHSGCQALALYRFGSEVCWIQPLTACCNVYFTRGTELDDPDGLLKGTSDRQRFVKVRSQDEVESLPLRAWIRQSVQLNAQAVAEGPPFSGVLERLRNIALQLPETRETLTWGRPYFRVREKIFCGCGEIHGTARISLKMDGAEAELLMKAPGVVKAPYSRPGHGWVQIDPATFDDWDEIQRLVVGSFCLIAPRKLAAAVK